MLRIIKKLFKKESNKEVKVNQYVQAVAEKTGWTYEQAHTQMLNAKAKVGIKFRDYSKYDFHLVPEDEQEKGYEEVLQEPPQRIQSLYLLLAER